MLNQNTQKILKELNKISNSAIIRYPKTIVASDSQDVIVAVDLSKTDDESFKPIHLMNSLGDFLKFLDLFEDPRIEIDDKHITAMSGKMKSSFIFDNPVLMSHLDKDYTQFERTLQVPSVAEFKLDLGDFRNINKASGIFKDLTEVILKSADSDLDIVLGATNSFNAKSNTFSVKKENVTTKNFEIKIPVENFKLLPVSNYTVHVKYNSSKDSYRIIMLNDDIDLQILLATKL